MILINGASVNHRSKEELYRKEIVELQRQVAELQSQLKAKIEEVEKLIMKVHKLGGRIKK